MTELTSEAKKAINKAVNNKLKFYATLFGVFNLIIVLGAAYSFFTAFDDEWKGMVDSEVRKELSGKLDVYSELIASNANNIQEQLNSERDRFGATKTQIRNLETTVTETFENSEKLRSQILSPENENLRKLFTLIEEGEPDSFFEVKNDISILQNSISKNITECRICAQTNNGGQCYPRNQNSCTDWSSLNTEGPSWSDWFRDDTDDDGGACNYRWAIECR